MKFLNGILMTSTLLLSVIAIAQNKRSILTVPGYNELSKIDTNGTSVLPSGRFITPAGTRR